MPIVIQKEYYTKEQVESEREKIFVFGDNYVGKGTGGQAKACRDQINTIGIITKWDEKRNPGSYMYDTTFELNKAQAMRGFRQILEILGDRKRKDQIIVFPADGFGTGLANLSENAPLTLEFISKMTEYCIFVDQINQLEEKAKLLYKELNPERYPYE